MGRDEFCASTPQIRKIRQSGTNFLRMLQGSKWAERTLYCTGRKGRAGVGVRAPVIRLPLLDLGIRQLEVILALRERRSDGAAESGHTLCASSTNRSLSASPQQIPMDRYVQASPYEPHHRRDHAAPPQKTYHRRDPGVVLQHAQAGKD